MSYRIRIKPDWLRVDTFHAPNLDTNGGAWGQKTFSGVRVMHEGLKLEGTATEGRSQYQNRELAMKKLLDAVEKLMYPDGGLNTPKIEWTLTPEGREYFDGKVMHKEFYGVSPRKELAVRFAEWSERNRRAMELAELIPDFKFNANRMFGKMGGLQQSLAYQQMIGRSFRKATVDLYQEALDLASHTYKTHGVSSVITRVAGDRWEVSPTLVFRDLLGNVGDIYAAD